MNKDGVIELQRIDCNCNDCVFLTRLLDKLNAVVFEDRTTQEYIFTLTKQRKISKATNDINNIDKHRLLIKNADQKIAAKKEFIKIIGASVFGYQGQRNQIQYGECSKLKKEIQFIPNILQLETQNCFQHRKDLKS